MVTAQGRTSMRAKALLAGFLRVATVMLAVPAMPALAQSNNVRISKLGDVAFGSLANLSADASDAQNICVFSSTSTNGYRVTASGSGSASAFTLASGASSLAYDVQWNALSGQASGTQLTPNVPLTAQVSSATQQACNSGPTTSASLIVILRSSALSRATAGSYSGTLTLIIGPE